MYLYITIPFTEDESICILTRWMSLFTVTWILNSSWMIECRAFSTFFGVGWSFDFLVTNTETVSCHIDVVQDSRNNFRPFSDIAGNSVLIPNQNLFNSFFFLFYEAQVSPQTAVLKTIHSNTVQFKNILTWDLHAEGWWGEYIVFVFCN